MTDVKRLLSEATPLPWFHHKYDLIVDDLGEPIAQVEDSEANAALIVAAVNHLPDYEAAVDALESVLRFAQPEYMSDDGAIDNARAALARLPGAA